MKVLHVIETLSPTYGGPVTILRTYARWLAAAGVDVTVCASDRAFPTGRIPGPLNTPTHVDGYSVWRFKTDFAPYAFSVQMGRWLAKNVADFDLVHIHGLYRYPQMAAAHHAFKNGVPYVMCPHGALDPFLYNKSERRRLKRIHERIFDFPAINRAAGILFAAEEERMLVEPLNFTAPKFILPNGIEANEFSRPDLDGRMRKKLGVGDRLLILFFGRLTRKKGLDITARAFAEVIKTFPTALLVIAGPDNEGLRPQIERWIAQAGVGANTIFTGMLEGEDRIALLRDADLFILHSYTENFGMSVAEALAAGTPVAITDKVNIWHEIIEANAGIATPCDFEAAANAMIHLLGDAKLRKQLAENGRALVNARFAQGAVTKRLIDVYEAVISNQGSRMSGLE